MQGDARFFLDRGLGPRIVPNGLRAAGWVVTTMDERNGVKASQSIDDATWIRDACLQGEVIITKDRAIAKRPLEAEAIYREELQRNPGNGWSLLGLAQSLKAQGRTREAVAVERQLAEAWRHADVKPTASRI